MATADILKIALSHRASDVMIAPEEIPRMRVDGKIYAIPGLPVFGAAQSRAAAYEMLTPAQIKRFEEKGDLDCGFTVPGIGRFRANVFLQIYGTSIVLRPISARIPTVQECALEPSIVKLTDLSRGLVLVTGQTGSGKSTTLAAMINHINETSQKHIITIEDPIEHIHKNNKSLIQQREVGVNVESFSGGLRSAMRENPDVILIGELRDLETAELALRAAETGHLCFATLHTLDAAGTATRMLSEFPPEQQDRVRLQLSNLIVGVICQTLLPMPNGGRICAREIMLMNSAIGSLIRENKIFHINDTIESSFREGMLSFDRSLAQLLVAGKIDYATAIGWLRNKKNFNDTLAGLGYNPEYFQQGRQAQPGMYQAPV